MEFGDGRHSSQLQLSTYFPAQNRQHEEKLKEAVMELFSETYRSKSPSSARFESVHKEKIKMIIEDRLSSMFPAILDCLPNHPPYAVMVMAAIRDLNEKGGSKEESISKYIKEHYENLPWAHPTILGNHLEKLVETGEILYVPQSRYRLPKSPDPEPNPTPKHEQQPKRKQGREPEQKVVRSLCEDDDGWIAIPKSKRTRVVEVECLEKQMPGRCLLPEQAEQQKTVEKSGFNEDVVIVHENDPLRFTIKLSSKQNGKGRGRGRPPKKQDTEQVEQQKQLSSKQNSRGRGRPPKKRAAEQVEQQKPAGETESNEESFKLTSRGRGRPPKKQAAEQVEQQKPVGETESNEDSSKQKSRGRGRPPKKRDAEQVEQQKPVGETESNEDSSKQKSRGRGRPPKKRDAEQVEQQNLVEETEFNQQPVDGMQVETETKEDCADQNAALGIIVENETNHNGLAGIEEVKEQPPVEEGDINVDLSNHHSMGLEVENQTDEDGSNHHVTVGTEVEHETNDDGTKQHLMIEQKEQQSPVEKFDINEDGSVVFEHVEQQELVVEGSDTDIKEDGSSQHPTGGIELGAETREDVSKLHVTVGTEVEWETIDDRLKQHLTSGIEQVEEQSPAEKPDANEDGVVVVEHLDQPQPVVEGSDFNEDGLNQHRTGGIEVGTETKEDVLKLHVTVGTEVGGETNDDCLEQHLENETEQVEQQPPAEKPDVYEDGSVVIEHVEQPQPVVEGSDINKVGSNQHPTVGVEVGTEANRDGNLYVTVDAAVESETNADGLRQHLIDGIEQVEQPSPVEKIDSNEDGTFGFEQVEEQQPVEGSGVSQDGSNQHPTFGIEGTEAKDEGSKQYGLVGIEVESETIDDCSKQHSVGEIEQVRQNPLVEKSDLSEDGLISPPDTLLTVKTAMAFIPHRRMPAEKQDTEQVELQTPVDESKSSEDGMNQHPTSGIEVTPLQQVKSGGRSPEKNKLRMQQKVVNDAIELMDDKTRGRARQKCKPEQQHAMSYAVEPEDGNGAKVEVSVTVEVEPAAVPKEVEPNPVRQTRGSARKKCTPEQQQAMRDTVEPGDGNGSKVEVAVKEEVEPVAVTKEAEPKPVRQTRGMARKKCTPEQQPAMSDAVEPRDGSGAKVEVAVTVDSDPRALPKEEEPRGRAPKSCAPEQQQQAMSDATEPTANNDATVEVAVNEDEEKLHLQRREQEGQGRQRPPKKHVHEPQQEDEIIVVAEEEEQKLHGRGGRRRGIGRDETTVAAAEKVHKPCGRRGRQRGRGQEEKKSCGQGGKQRGRGPEETVMVVEEEEQKPCGQVRGRERGREETMQRKGNKTHVDEDEVKRKQWWQKRSNKSHVGKEEVKREVEEEERPWADS